MSSYYINNYCGALMLDELEDYENVIDSLTEHLSTNDHNSFAYNNRALAYWEIGKPELALADFERAVQFAPNDSKPLKNRAHLREAMGDMPGALSDFDRGVRIDPNEPYLLRSRASARLKAENLVGALEDLSRAIDIQPSVLPGQYVNRAKILDRLGRREEAIRDRQTADRLEREST